MSYSIGIRPGEFFAGNVALKDGVVALPEYLVGFRTARLGEQPLDIYGKKIDPACMRPLFIHSDESAKYERVMMVRTFPGWRRA